MCCINCYNNNRNIISCFAVKVEYDKQKDAIIESETDNETHCCDHQRTNEEVFDPEKCHGIMLA